MRTRALLVSAALLLAAGGCSVSGSIENQSLSGTELAEKLSPLVEKEFGSVPDSISCQKLAAEVGATTTCKLRINGRQLDLTVTASQVDGSDVTPSFEVEGGGQASGTTSSAPAPTASSTTRQGVPVVPPAELEKQLTAGLEAQVGQAPPPVTCAQPLQGVIGATGICILTDGTDRYEITLTVTAVTGTDVKFDFAVATEPL